MSRCILTNSGQQVSADAGCPTIDDVALGLSRAMRFGGQGRCRWSVLQHSLLCEAFAQQHACLVDDATDGVQLRLVALLHDAHESVTGDIPTPLKVPQQQEIQHAIDARLFPMLAPELDAFVHEEDTDPPYGVWDLVGRFDRRALLAEACVVGPPCLQTAEDVEEHFGEQPYENDVAAVCRMLGSHAGLSAEGLQKLFIARYYALRTMLHATPAPTPLERTRAIMENVNQSLALAAPHA